MTFIFSKLLWGLLAPGSLLIFLLAAGLVMRESSFPYRVRIGKNISFGVCAFFLVMAVLPVGRWALTPLESRFTFKPPQQVDGIIILGGDENTDISEARQTPIALESLQRYVVFADMAKRYPSAKLVFSGGSSELNPSDKNLLDADIARVLLSEMGAPTKEMITETKSRNTYENAVFTKEIVKPQSSQNWLLVTSAWHMPRAIGCFRRAGWTIYAVPAGYFTPGTYQLQLAFRFDEQLRDLTMAMHEYVGLFAYWLMGRTSELWPG